MYDAAILYKRFRQRRQVWHFGLDPEAVSEFVAEYGWRLVEQAGPDYFVRNYIEPTGRDLHRIATRVVGVRRKVMTSRRSHTIASRAGGTPCFGERR